MDDLRQAVLQAAQRGLRRAPAKKRLNPLYSPDARFGIMARVVGNCRTISEAIAQHGAEFVLGGFTDAAMRTRNLTAIEAARSDLDAILRLAGAGAAPQNGGAEA